MTASMLDNAQLARQILGTAAGTNIGKGAAARGKDTAAPGVFAGMLDREMGLKFSKHATQRLASRGIELSSGDMERINRAVDTARQKGARDSLVLLDRLALVVSIKNNTVITAVNEDAIKENVFTNIDSAVIAK